MSKLIFAGLAKKAVHNDGKTDQMKLTIERQTKITFVVFLVTVFLIFVIQIFWIWPGQRCEEAGMWWDWRTRACARPVLISSITGRVIKDDAARDAAKAEVAKLKAASKPN